MADELVILSVEHLLIFLLLLDHSILDDLQGLRFGPGLPHSRALLQECSLWHGGGFALKYHWRWTVGLVKECRH